MIKENIFLGIDGGGTKTAFILENEGEIFEHKEKTLHLKQVSRDVFVERLNSGINKVCEMAGVKVKDIVYTFMAMPGFGQFPEDEDFILENLEKTLESTNFKVGNDCVNGWAGSLNASPGINLVLGTGSIAFGVDDDGKSLMCGGWGPYIGDEASGYYIGKKILNVFTKISDKRLEKSPIYDLIKKEMKIEDDFEIISKSMAMERDELANLSKLLSKALEENDKNALDIIDTCAKEAALMINTLIKDLNFKEEVKVSYSGGVFKIGQILIEKIKEYADDRVCIVKPYADPSTGSLILAKRYYEKGEMI